MTPATAAAQAISRALAAEVVSRTAWDEPPCLYTIHMRAGQCRLRPVPVPLGIWAAGRPPDVLEGIALAAEVAWQAQPGARRRSDLYGTAFRCEGWGVDMRGLDAAQRREAQDDSAAHRIHGRSDRIEYRFMIAAGRDGIAYSAFQQRGEDQALTGIFQPGSDLRQDGAVPDALCRMTAALSGIEEA